MNSLLTLPGYKFTSTIDHSGEKLIRRAVYQKTGAPVVVKQLAQAYPSLRARRSLEFEHSILSEFQHPGIVRAVGLVAEGGRYALILEDFGADNVVPESGQGSAIGEFLDLAIQTVKALSQVHAQGVIHKDIKPHNIVMNQSSKLLKLIDFQLASRLSVERQDINTVDRLEGSLPYLSPEQTGRMNRDLDYRTDFYSLGVTFFQLLTGELPFSATDTMGWIHAHISKAAPLPHEVNPNVPEVLSRLVGRLMAKVPDERYQSSRSLLADLEECRARWASGARIDAFPIGRKDLSEKFQISRRLVGREAEVAQLDREFAEARAGEARVLLVSGYSGVGKSSLVRELAQSVVAARGAFVSGKFDQLKRDVPYGALIGVLAELTQRLLTEPEDRLEVWRTEILSALGDNASLITELVPDLQEVVGERPPAPHVNPAEAQVRFRRVLGKFLGVFAHSDRPLVVFLDDLQWSDASTPDFIFDTLLSGDLQHVLVVCAFRDNEVGPEHLVSRAIRRVRKLRPDLLAEVSLKPLSLQGVTSIVADSLRQSREAASDLAKLVFDKTSGNPFFAVEVLENLYRSEAIALRPQEGNWECDMGLARRAPIGKNVLELLLARFRFLSQEARKALCLASCMGNKFQVSPLAALLEVSVDSATRILNEAVAKGLIVPQGDDYRLLATSGTGSSLDSSETLELSFRFQHDRIQQAAHSLLDAEELTVSHLSVGRWLLGGLTEAELEERLFEVVNHLNLGRCALSDLSERARLADLNIRAAERAKRSTAYRIAANHLGVAIELSSTLREEWGAERVFEVHWDQAECSLMAGEPEVASEWCRALLDRSQGEIQRATVHLLQVRVCEAQANLVAAVGEVRSGLKLLGVHLPEDPKDIEQGIGAGIGTMQQHLGSVSVDKLSQLPEMTTPEHQLTVKLLFQGIPAAIQTNPALFILAELLMFDLTVQHGVTPVAAKNFVDCGIIQGGMLGDYATAYQLGRAAFEVLERFKARGIASSVNFVFATYVSSWRAPCEEAMAAFEESHRAGMETGDIQHVGFSTALRLHRLLHIGHELGDCREEFRQAASFLEKSQLSSPRVAIVLVERALTRLCDVQVQGAELKQGEQAAQQLVLESQNPQWIYAFGESQMVVSVLLGEFEEAERWREWTAPQLPSALGLISVPEFHLCEALIISRHMWQGASTAERGELLEGVREIRDKLKVWADNSPENFSHKYHLVAAEQGRLENTELGVVLEHYKRAASCTGAHYMHMRALAQELQARFWKERGDEVFAAALFQQARDLYARWGAKRKALRMDEQEAPPQVHSSQTLSRRASVGTVQVSRTLSAGGALDLSSVLKANQVISSEVKSEQLFSSLMGTLLENAAAQRGSLISVEEKSGRLLVEVQSGSNMNSATRLNLELTDAKEICADAVRYVVRTREPLVIGDALTHSLISKDPYVVDNEIRSVLCLPIMSQGQVVAVLYAENNATSQAFPVHRVETLKLIAGQAAISIENARLYDELEARVESRTQQLAAKTREVAAMLDGLEQGVFLVGSDLRIEAQYSRRLPTLIGQEELVGKPFLSLLFGGSSVGSDACATMAMALRASFGQKERYVRVNLEHLIQDYERVREGGQVSHFEVEWKPICGATRKVEKFLIVLRDVTVMRGLREAEQRNARQTELVSLILSCGVSEFRGFCETTRILLDQLGREAHSPDAQKSFDLERVFRDIHTAKGSARMLNLSEVVDEFHAAESLLDDSRQESVTLDWAALTAHMKRIRVLLQEFEVLGQERLGSLWTGESNRLVDAIREIEEVLSGDQNELASASPTLARIRQTIRVANSVPLATLFGQVTRSTASLASEAGVSEPTFHFDDGGVLVSTSWAAVLKDCLVHSLRNSLDHGIESKSERLAKGKSEKGQLSWSVEQHGDQLRICLRDDGRGLALARLRELRGNESKTDQELAESVFESKVSTALETTELSGRGVGMMAMRSYLRERSSEMHLVFTGDADAGHRPFQLEIDLPAEARVD